MRVERQHKSLLGLAVLRCLSATSILHVDVISSSDADWLSACVVRRRRRWVSVLSPASRQATQQHARPLLTDRMSVCPSVSARRAAACLLLLHVGDRHQLLRCNDWLSDDPSLYRIEHGSHTADVIGHLPTARSRRPPVVLGSRLT